jgi:multidrug resistance efflux pump
VFNKVILPLLALGGLAFAIFSVVQARQAPPPSRPVVPPPAHPEFRAIAGAGLVEARRENIPIGTTVPGVVTEVFVSIEPGGRRIVKAGDPLFQIDDRAARAEIRVREAMLAAAEAELEKLRKAPRPEDIPPAVAAVAEAQARYDSAEVELKRSARLIQQNAVTSSEYDTQRATRDAARAALDKANADLARLRKGTWQEDILVAEAAVAQAQSQLDAARIDLDRLTVRALVPGEVLQVNVRPGQFAALAWKEPLVVVGDLTKLHVRVDIDEQDLPLFTPGARAVATLKGRPQVRFDLEFVKVEPYVIPKRSLTGDNSERVDTRVLQVIYALPEARPMPLFVGQQMDVYIEAATTPDGVDLDNDAQGARPFEDGPAKAAAKAKGGPAA